MSKMKGGCLCGKIRYLQSFYNVGKNVVDTRATIELRERWREAD